MYHVNGEYRCNSKFENFEEDVEILEYTTNTTDKHELEPIENFQVNSITTNNPTPTQLNANKVINTRLQSLKK
jgi:hypothetical protein